MAEITVTVKWAKQVFKGVAITTAEGALDELKAKVLSLTGVPMDRQKLIVKGKQIKDDAGLGKLKKGAKIFLMGSAEELPAAPAQPIRFIEDMTEAERALMAPERKFLSAGLQNLGNTCYMNSTIQCLRGIPELKQNLASFAARTPRSNDIGDTFTSALGNLYSEMELTEKPVVPFMFTQTLRTMFPQFAETDEKGRWKQQDADECLSSVLTTVGNKCGQSTKDLFAGELQGETYCPEAEEEGKTPNVESFTKLKCFIDGKTNYLYQGVLKGLSDEFEKRSPSLGRNAVYKKEMKISKMPQILVVNFVRFFWKSTGKAKILRKVIFPERLDVTQFTTKGLTQTLNYWRQRLKKESDKKMGIKPLAQDDEAAPMDSAADVAPEDLLPTDSSGFYELFGVVTHQGREADAGHYIGWVRKSPGSEIWFKFDDDVVSEQKTEDILRLHGGGDWHTNYLNFYRRVDDLKGKVWEDEEASPAEAEAAPSTE